MTKNNKNSDMRKMLNKKRERMIKEKDTDFTVNERSVSRKKIERYERRKNVEKQQILSSAIDEF